jgi:hypothetical protein
MSVLNNHNEIRHSLETMVESGNVPHLLFYGDHCVGKNTLLTYLLSLLYKKQTSDLVMDVNCATGKGIKFVREELKFFAQSKIDETFKCVILRNMDYLTIEAQSALRRCIEIFSSSTRFFVIVRYKERLLKPILSRFSLIYVSYPYIEIPVEKIGSSTDVVKHYVYNFYYFKQRAFLKNIYTRHIVKKTIEDFRETTDKIGFIQERVKMLYEKGISGRDIIKHVELDEYSRSNLEFYYYKIKRNIRNDKMIMMMLFYSLNQA